MIQLKMRDYPHLPLLPVDKCLRIFARGCMRITHLHEILGRSRMTLYYWRTAKRVPANSAMQDISMLAYKTARALNSGLLPLSAASSVADFREALSDSKAKPLHELTAREMLLPLMSPAAKVRVKAAARAKVGVTAHGNN